MLTVRFFKYSFLLENQSFTHLIAGRAACVAGLPGCGPRRRRPRTLLADLLWENMGEQQANQPALSPEQSTQGELAIIVAQGESVAFNREPPLGGCNCLHYLYGRNRPFCRNN